VQCVAALIVVIVLARTCDFGKGFAAGIGAGALTQTAMLGTAGDAVLRLGLGPDEATRLNSEMAVAFAMTYVFGTIGVIVFLRSVAPRWLGVDMKQAARELEEELSDGGKVTRPGYITPFVPVVSRAFEVKTGKAANRTIAELEKKFNRATVERVVRDDEVVEHTPELVVKAGDVVGVAGRLPGVVAAGDLLGEEVESKEALSFPVKVVSVVITDKRIAGKTLRQVRDNFSPEDARAFMCSASNVRGCHCRSC